MLSFIAENGSLLLVVQSNQLIEHVSSRLGLEGLGIFPRTKNTRLPGFSIFLRYAFQNCVHCKSTLFVIIHLG